MKLFNVKRYLQANELILVACFPKSGSSFISRNLASVVAYEFRHISGSKNPSRNRDITLTERQYLDFRRMRKLRGQIVSQAHILPTSDNLGLIEKFDVRTIVLARNLSDVAISLREHFLNDSNGLRSGVLEPPNFNKWGFKEQVDFVIDMHLPWYVTFFASWSSLGYPIHYYEDMVDDQSAFFLKLLDQLDKQKAATNLGVIDKENQPGGRFNQGLVGRGRQLSAAQLERVFMLTKHYPSTDFSRIL